MSTRSAEKEKLDDLSLQGEPLHKALKSLAWINRWFGNQRAVINAILSICEKEKKPLHIIDLGCGGGDLILAVAKALRKKGIEFTITGIDGNANSLGYAEINCAGFAEIKFLHADILNDEFKIEPCDILISSHFIYHFSEEGLIRFLRNNSPVIARAIIFSELERRRFAILLFKLGRFLLPISKLAKQDGLLAIKRSFTKKEWLSILQKTGISSFSLQRVPLFRIRLVIFSAKRS